MKEFTVRIPMTGYVDVTVEAEDMDAAIDKALDMATLDDLVEWSLHRTITEGNISHALLNEIDAYEEK